jgi:hypothetical protein
MAASSAGFCRSRARRFFTEKHKTGAALTGADALALAKDVLGQAAKHRRNQDACRELTECIAEAERRLEQKS